MKITIERTDDVREMNGIPVRRWEGITERGLRVDVIVQSVRPKDDAGMAALKDEWGGGEPTRMPSEQMIASSPKVNIE